ncbi:uncharacterized protein CXQ87_000058 [Candidozyma duobushaemuli]|uniref:Zn(2)-C6 fungal-type domain-containing protein n=1 Tax=Candidozyma duobushaemuli TaxID=1231522 RepID=A0A2V1AFQ6_9ASCO|nr:uncharacterized protein CXQ87_000058 [[Candida] duobushaemulonis]PVH17177.1 hypothetical protein CXQ87_000058 [[Candida] duobushaemulonis]
MDKPSRKRSRNGCFTCRRRKKKCDESSYPQCRNCHTNELQCTWPEHVVKAKTLRGSDPENVKMKPEAPEAQQSILPQQRLGRTIDPATLISSSPNTYTAKEGLRRRSDPHLPTLEESYTNYFSQVPESGVPQISQPVLSGTPQQEYRISKPKIEAERKNEKKSNYFLQRIAMQQDCVEEEDKEEEDVYENVDKDLIRNFIAHQMDLGDTFKRA